MEGMYTCIYIYIFIYIYNTYVEMLGVLVGPRLLGFRVFGAGKGSQAFDCKASGVYAYRHKYMRIMENVYIYFYTYTYIHIHIYMR